MFQRPLGRSPLHPSVLGLGGLHFGVYCDAAETTRIVHRALDVGFTFIETAPMYGGGHSETLLGEALRGRREGVLLSTKVGLEPTRTPEGAFGVKGVPLTPARIRESLETSLRALRTDRVDLLQLHAYDTDTPLEETLGELEALRREGKLLEVGCSNFDPEEFERARAAISRTGSHPFASFQVHYNLLERRAEEAVLPACRTAGVGVICNRALARGLLSAQYKPGEPLPPGSRGALSPRVRGGLVEPDLSFVAALDRHARGRGISAATLSVAWLLSRPGVTVVLAGVRKAHQREDWVQGAAWALDDEDFAVIEGLAEEAGLNGRLRSRPSAFLER